MRQLDPNKHTALCWDAREDQDSSKRNWNSTDSSISQR